METIITNLISKYLLPGTRVKSHENHAPCLAHFSETHWQALLLCHRGSEPHILSLVEASPREPERGVRAALPALFVLRETVLFIYGDGRHMSGDGRRSQRAQPAAQLPGETSALPVGEKSIWKEIRRSQT